MVSIEDCKVYVIHCIVQRFGPLEALAYLRSKGIENPTINLLQI